MSEQAGTTFEGTPDNSPAWESGPQPWPLHHEDEPEPRRAHIFHYTLGDEARCADPFKVERIFSYHLGGDTLGAVIKSAFPGKDAPHVPELMRPEQERLIQMAREAFSMPELDIHTTEGYSEQDAMDTLTAFLRWRGEVKKNTASPVTPSPSTAQESSVGG